MKSKLSVLLLSAVLFTTSGCGKNNIFSWAHSAGSSSGISALSTDASQALQNKDFAKALEYYSKILDSDPNNSEAIYGYSAAKLADSGMDISRLVANLVRQNNSPAYNRLAPAIAFAASSSPSSTATLLPDKIITNRVKIRAAVDDVLNSRHLLKIIKGMADGKINPESADINLNIAFCLVLRAGLKVYDSGSIQLNDDYSVTVNSQNMSVANDAGRDIASAYQRLLIVAVKLGFIDNNGKVIKESSITNIKDDVNKLFADLKSKITGFSVNIDHDYLLD